MWEPRIRLVDVTLVLDTAIYASGDVLVVTQAAPNAMRVPNLSGELVSMLLIDEDDQKAALDVYFLDANVSFGALNAAAAPSDIAARSILGVVPVVAIDYKDLGGVSIAYYRSLGIALKPAIDTGTIYIVVVNGAGTPTYTASGLKLRLGIKD